MVCWSSLYFSRKLYIERKYTKMRKNTEAIVEMSFACFTKGIILIKIVRIVLEEISDK